MITIFELYLLTAGSFTSSLGVLIHTFFLNIQIKNLIDLESLRVESNLGKLLYMS